MFTWDISVETVSWPIYLAVKQYLGPQDQIFVTLRQLQVCSCGGALTDDRGLVCHLQPLLAFASAVIFTVVKISRTRHLYLQLYMPEFYIV
jgi:hypothetical protein